MRAIWVVVVLSACKRGVDAETCKTTTEALEKAIVNDVRRVDALSAVSRQLGDAPAPRVAGGRAIFEPGLTLPLASPVLLDALAEEACAKQPMVVYLLAAPDAKAALLGERVATIEASAKAWGVAIEPRLVVKLPAKAEYNDWPKGTTDELKQFAKDVFAMPDGRLQAISKRLERAAGSTCFAAIGKQTEQASGSLEQLLALPRGLRDCECRTNLDEVIPAYHLLQAATTEASWVGLSTTAGTLLPDAPTVGGQVAAVTADGAVVKVRGAAAPVAALACGALQSIMLEQHDDWKTAPPELPRIIVDTLATLDECLRREHYPVSDVLRIRIGTKSYGDGKTLDVDATGFAHERESTALRNCVHPIVEVESPAEGETILDVYVPQMARP